jgi:deoxyhypusine synthase
VIAWLKKNAVRICPEPERLGGLSGCPYIEGVSWGKFVAPKDGGRFAEVPFDFTLAWPLLMMAVRERLAKMKTNETCKS